MEKVNQRLSESTTAMLLFDLTMSYVMAMRDTPMKWKVRQAFDAFDKAGLELWNRLIDQLRKDGREHKFDDLNAQLNQLFREFLECNDPDTMLALMHAFNRGEVQVTNDTQPEAPADEMIINRQIVEHQQRHLHDSNITSL
mgnify:CR=1 FL=1